MGGMMNSTVAHFTRCAGGAAAVLLLAVAGSGAVQAPGSDGRIRVSTPAAYGPIVPQQDTSVLTVETDCSETELRTPVATLRIRQRSVPATERVDVATTEAGLKEVGGIFASIPVGEARRLLSLSAVGPTRQQPTAVPLELEVESRDTTADRREVVIEVGDLRPGINYYWQLKTRPRGGLWTSLGPIVQTRTPICSADTGPDGN